MRQTASQRAATENTERQEAEKKRLENEAREAEIIAGLPADFAYSRIHVYPLYGTSGTVRVGAESHYSSLGEDERCTWEEVAALLSQFPPVPRVIHEDGCCGIRCADFVDERNKERDAMAKRTPIFGVTVVVDPGYGGAVARVEWVTRLPNGVQVEIECFLLPKDHPGYVRVQARTDRRTGERLEIEKVDFIPAPNYPGFAARTASRGDRTQGGYIKYGGGGRTDPGHYLFYWLPSEVGDKSAPDFFRSLRTVPAAAV